MSFKIRNLYLKRHIDMSAGGVVTVLSDFGLSDPYVGVMKGVMVQINRTLTVIDLTHHIPPQNIDLARLALMAAIPYFPEGTVHLAVVDPGVGSDRRSVAVAIGVDPAAPLGYLVGPDNGLFSGVLSQYPGLMAVELNHPQYWRTPTPSSTFHGRDIFAPVAAHLASEVPLVEVGTAIAVDSLITLSPLAPKRKDQTLVGCIQAVDHFGNLVTNISAQEVNGQAWYAIVNGVTVPGRRTYSEGAPGELLAIVGSHFWVEIAVNQGHAQSVLNLGIGDCVQVVLQNHARKGEGE
jgi:S-adenosyl-L-methionine hydrolase (adenosine-forming)